MKKAIVLGGATGLLGQALCHELEKCGWQARTLGRQDGNLLDLAFLEDRLRSSGADVVFNAVAWTQVDLAEDHPEEALLLNRTLPDSLATIIAAMEKVQLVHFSTDFVFSGQKSRAFREDDPTLPGCIYASTKLAGEKAVLRILPERSCVIRTAWLFGPGRSDFVDKILAACQKMDAIRVVHDQCGSPTYTRDLASWSVALADRQATGVWHGVNSGQASWCDLACEAITLTASPCRVEAINSDDWPQKANRPAWSVLDNSKLGDFLGKKPRPWPQALREYLFTEYPNGVESDKEKTQ